MEKENAAHNEVRAVIVPVNGAPHETALTPGAAALTLAERDDPDNPERGDGEAR